MKSPRGELQPFSLKRGPWHGWFHPRVGPELSSAWLAAPENLGKAPFKGPSPDGHWFIKARAGRKGRRALERSFIRGLELEETGLPTPVHMAVIEGQGQSWLIAEYLPGQDLDHALIESGRAAQTALVGNLASAVAALHTAGFRQRDLKAPNIRVSEEGTVLLVDLEGVAPSTSQRKQTKDLGRLAASFIALEQRGLSPELWPDFIGRYRQALPEALKRSYDLADQCRKLGERKVSRNIKSHRPLR